MKNSTRDDYGKCSENPVRLSSIPASRFFLNNLVTVNGEYLVYHRLDSLPVNEELIDHYEVFTTGYHYDDIYISIYNQRNTWIPPAGYLFEDGILCPDLTEEDKGEEMEEIIESVMQGIDKQYFYKDKKTIEDFMLDMVEGDVLNTFIERSVGVNFKTDKFPVSFLKSYLKTLTFLSEEKQYEIVKKIPKREKQDRTELN